MIFEKVSAIIAEQFDMDVNDIKESTALVEDLGVDSIDLVDLIMSFEDEFDMEFPDEDVENIKTVGDIVEYIEDRI